jgi:hypothetical protein
MKKKDEKIGRTIFFGVIGAGKTSQKIRNMAEEIGKEIAEIGGVLVCGGLGGVMEGAAKGAKEEGGVTIGILPGEDKAEANPYIDYPIVTGFGEARNLVVIRTADVIIALPGKYGTLSELSFALKLGKPVVGINTWSISDRIRMVKKAKDAVKAALEELEKNVEIKEDE